MRLIVLVIATWATWVTQPATAAAAPSGRVIRIERAGGPSTVAPRLCEIRGETGTCVGDEPRVGQTVVVLDERRVLAEVQVTEVASVVAACPNLWSVKTRPVRGAPTDGNGNSGIGVIDPALNPSRAHVLDRSHLPTSPGGMPNEEVWRAIDRDGDGTADIMITRYTCDSSSKPQTGGSNYCIDVWARVGPRLVRTTQLNFAQCNI
ncbi:MAG TPA: hypothetical protein VFD36_08720 [Kofleriaceae bacterium]|nr:hypothetical protein [Kofleriaceae bacterium]